MVQTLAVRCRQEVALKNMLREESVVVSEPKLRLFRSYQSPISIGSTRKYCENTGESVEMEDIKINEVDLQKLYSWVDQIPLSRKKKSITRDFSDGILVAEIVKHFIPRLVELHNYASANSTNQKLNNWQTLNRKVLSKLNFTIPASVMQDIAECKSGVIENFLFRLWQKIEEYLVKKKLVGYPERPYYNVRSDGRDVDIVTRGSAESNATRTGIPEYTIKNPIPLSQLSLDVLDTETRLILEEKEQALLASMETVQIQQVKIQRLEHLLRLKDLRIQDLQERQSRYDPET